jgi:hypothetical protein
MKVFRTSYKDAIEPAEENMRKMNEKIQKIFFRTKPLLYVLSKTVLPHQRIIGDWVIRETYELLDDSTLPKGTVSYSIWIETDVSSPKEIQAKKDTGFKIADDLNRVWTYVRGQPINAARLGLVFCDAPAAWTTNIKEVEKKLDAEISGMTGNIIIQPGHCLMYVTELPLSKALDVYESYKTAPDFIRALIELHYSALTSKRSEDRLIFFAKALEMVRGLYPGKSNQQIQDSLPVNITSNLQQSLHWLFGIANNRFDVRHVVQQKGTPPVLHPRISMQEHQSFEHDADLIIRTVICRQLGHEPFLVKYG